MSKSKAVRRLLKYYLRKQKQAGKAARLSVSGERKMKKRALEAAQAGKPDLYKATKAARGLYSRSAEWSIKIGKHSKKLAKEVKEGGGL